VQVRALDDVSFTIAEGDMVCIMGKSGSGKSTLLRQLGLLDRPSEGEIVLDII
jgi:putative ABC transport system ATP-binding protein